MINEIIKDLPLSFDSDPTCFSPDHVDFGTLAMLSFVEFEAGQKVLDLGCGYGVVGITAAKFTDPGLVYMTDVSETAVTFVRQNALQNGVEGVHVLLGNAYENLDEAGFDLILSNPPYHTDFSVAKTFIEKGFNRLKLGGRFYMVTKRREWYKNKFIAIFGGVIIREKDGYFVFEAQKRDSRYGTKTKSGRS